MLPVSAFPSRLLRPALLLLALLPALGARAQTLTGTVREAPAGPAIPYVNIGIPGKAVGTVADEQGRYQLTYTATNLADTVRLSSVGFEPRLLLLRELLARPDVALTPAAVPLADVRVQAAGLYKRALTLGNTSESKVILVGFKAQDFGAEAGAVIKLRHQPTNVRQAVFNLLYDKPEPLIFRVNLYRLGPDGSPSEEKLNRRNIIVSSADRPNNTGPLVVDLAADNLVLDEDFVLALEWVSGSSAEQVSKGVYFSGSLSYFGKSLYSRRNSQGSWKKVAAGGKVAGMQPHISFYVNALD